MASTVGPTPRGSNAPTGGALGLEIQLGRAAIDHDVLRDTHAGPLDVALTSRIFP